MKTNKLDITTTLAIQGAISASLILIIGNIFSLERSYWGVMTAMAILCYSWGESVKKAFMALTGTFLGASCAIIISIFIPESEWIKIALVITSMFMFVYTSPVSYIKSIFWIVTMVVIIFSFTGLNNVHIAFVRIYQTALGAITGIIVSRTVFPIYGKMKAGTEFISYLSILKKNCLKAFDILLSDEPADSKHPAWGRKILSEYESMQNWYNALFFEVSIFSPSRKIIQNHMMLVSSTGRFVTALLETVEQTLEDELIDLIRHELKHLKNTLGENFDTAANAINNRPIKKTDILNIEPDICSIREKLLTLVDQGPRSRKMLLKLGPVIYYCIQIHETLVELAGIQG